MEQLSPARIEKGKEVEIISASFKKATSMVVLGYQGMDVPSVTELRARFRKAGVEYRVVKNTLFHQAIKGTPLAENKALEKALTGMNGIAFSFEDPSAAAKIVKQFRKEGDKFEKLQVKAGILESSVMAGPEVESTLATMPGKDELRAMLLATLQAPMQKLVQQLQAPSSNLVYAIEARRKQQGGE